MTVLSKPTWYRRARCPAKSISSVCHSLPFLPQLWRERSDKDDPRRDRESATLREQGQQFGSALAGGAERHQPHPGDNGFLMKDPSTPRGGYSPGGGQLPNLASHFSVRPWRRRLPVLLWPALAVGTGVPVVEAQEPSRERES
jgi:hypothetical protein